MAEINFNALKSYGGNVSERKFNAVVDALQAITLCNGVGYTVSRNPNGTVLQTKAGKGGIGSACPFDALITDLEPVSSTDKNLRVRVGSVNDLLPTNIFDDFTFTVSSVIKIKLRVVTDGQKVTGSSLIVDNTACEIQTPTPFALPASVDVLVGVVVGGKPYRTIPCGSIVLEGHEEFKLDKDPPAEPGELPYTPYYAWKLKGA